MEFKYDVDLIFEISEKLKEAKVDYDYDKILENKDKFKWKGNEYIVEERKKIAEKIVYVFAIPEIDDRGLTTD